MIHKKRIAIAAILCLLLLAGVFVFLKSSPFSSSSPSPTSDEPSGRTPSSNLADNSTTGDQATKPGSPASSRPENSSDSTSPTRTKKAVRPEAGVMKDGLLTYDLAYPASEMPAWPAGPKLHAGVSTATKRYFNLRPDTLGSLPEIFVAPEEPVTVDLQFPENSPGDRIYVEFADGGRFSEDPNPGRVFTLGAERTLSIPIIADPRRGNFDVLIRQSGHTRTLPLWVGAPLELASDDAQ